MTILKLPLFSFIQIITFLMCNKNGNGGMFPKENLNVVKVTAPNISDLEPASTHLEGQCKKLQCKYICSNGSHLTIERNVNVVHNTKECEIISELYLINYHFPRKTLPKKFLKSLSDRVNHLTIYSSDIEHIDPGAFESQTLRGVHLENLKLKHVDKGIFENLNPHFTNFTLIQKNPELKSVDENFLEFIKYQIRKLTIQTGLMKVEDLTSSQCLLNSLDDIDLSYNNFGGTLKTDSFHQLSMVQKLNLTHSAITFLPESIFNGIIVTLKVLDLSNNELLVVDRNIFGWRNPGKSLALYLNGNPWKCSCDLLQEMTVILAFQDKKVYCQNMENVFVTSYLTCPHAFVPVTETQYESTEINSNTVEGILNAKVTSTELIQTTELLIASSASKNDAYATTHELECHKDNEKLETENVSIHWPNTAFDIVKKHMASEVDIVIKKKLNETYGVLWFSKVTLQYYKMETNHNEYGLGCYGRVDHVTTINHLLPNFSYTFCLILKDQLTVSPFSCKSVYIDDNLDIRYNVWLTNDMKATGISIMIIGSILFMFLGVVFIFVLLKHKPALLKGSKRVVTQKGDTSNIIVFPENKTLHDFKLMEEQLASRKIKGYPTKRLSSVSSNSLDSIQSYINSENIYEMIPANISSNVRYAEVPLKRNRGSNDPLPEIPNICNEISSSRLPCLPEVLSDKNCETSSCLYI